MNDGLVICWDNDCCLWWDYEICDEPRHETFYEIIFLSIISIQTVRSLRERFIFAFKHLSTHCFPMYREIGKNRLQ
jgi:hypothetical protein